MGRLSILVAVTASALVLAGPAGTRPAVDLSNNWSGYIEKGGGPYSVTSATFNVPNLTAASTSTSASEWVGIDGTDPKDQSLIQAGVRETYDPRANRVHLVVWWEILPALESPVTLPVSVGDRVNASIGRVSTGRWQIEIRNLTRGKSFVTMQPYAGPGRTADWIVEAPSDARGTIQTLGHYVPDVTFGDVRLLGRRGALHPQSLIQRGAIVSEVSKLGRTSFTVAYRG